VTERWRKKLEGIDGVGPSDDVYERAKHGPTMPEPQSPMQRTSTRVVTAIAAFVVFALGISVFAIPALRLGGEQRVVTAGAQVQPLWPWSSTDEAKAWKEAPSPVGLTGSSDFFAPDSTATAFGREVLGWSDVWAHEGGTPQTFPCTLPSNVAVAYPEMSSAPPTSNELCSMVLQGGSLPPTMASYASTTSRLPFRTFDLSTCPPNTACDYAWPGPPAVSVVVYQPLGADGPWAVLEAKNQYVGLSLAPGTELHDGSTVYASGTVPSQTHAILGYDASLTGCGETGTTGTFEATNTEAGSDPVSGLSETYARGQLDLTLPAQEASCARQSGYAFLVISRQKVAFADVLHGLPAEAGVLLFAAVPVSFLFPSTQGSSGPPTSPPPSPNSPPVNGYTDPRGWTIDVPDGWITRPIETGTTHESWSGAWFGTGEPTDAVVTDPERMTPGRGDVLVILDRHEHVGLHLMPQDDSSLPLTFKQLAPVDGGYRLDFRADGQPFTLSVRVSQDGLTDQQLATVGQMVASIRFQPWEVDESRNGWTALRPTNQDDPAEQQATISWQFCHHEGCYVLVYGDYGPGGNGPYVLGPIQPCGEGENMTANPASMFRIVLECPDGTTQAWGAPGEPSPSNSTAYDRVLNVYPVIHAWDGNLLTSVTTG